MQTAPKYIPVWYEHAAFWLFIFLFVLDYHFVEDNYGEAVGRSVLEVFTYSIIVYANLFLLIPYSLARGKNVFYAFLVVVAVLCYVFFLIASGLESTLYEHGGWRNSLSMVLNAAMFLLISTLYWYFKKGQLEKERFLRKKSEMLEAELKSLRTQISPHFLFNTLNNVYSLALQNHENTAPMVAKLSELLRHILYEGKNGVVSLSKELDMLEQYIALHLYRKPQSDNIDFYMEGSTKDWLIAPLLLITFVENAIKHSNVHEDATAWIKIDGEMESDTGWFAFRTQNSKGTATKGGIGLENVKKQLELLYSGNYHIDIQDEPETFAIELRLLLKKA